MVLEATAVTKTYASGFQALKAVDLSIRKGEIFALLGPNGAGKTTLISIVCGIVRASSGRVVVDGADVVAQYKQARAKIGLVPQELTLDVFESVWNTVSYSRGLFGKPRSDAVVERVLRSLTLWDKRDARLMALSGGMKRRVMIAKALSHEPSILFLDEPTAGVDVELRRDMWALVRALRDEGVTIILTTHYIEEAEEMADRVGVINKGELMLVEDKDTLMRKLGGKRLTVELAEPVGTLPASLAAFEPQVSNDRRALVFQFDPLRSRTDMPALMAGLAGGGLVVSDITTRQTTLEEIFVGLVAGAA